VGRSPLNDDPLRLGGVHRRVAGLSDGRYRFVAVRRSRSPPDRRPLVLGGYSPGRGRPWVPAGLDARRGVLDRCSGCFALPSS